MNSIPGSAKVKSTLSKMPTNQPVNINELLNFTLPPRQQWSMGSLPRRSRRTGAVQGIWNKERFVNAQYRFVMNPVGDYTVHFADPDIFFQWQDVLQVIIPRSSTLASTSTSNEMEDSCTMCPICLSPPTSPRMTRCGHVFCYPCILHYLGVSENKWARCPICFDSVNQRQLKAVKWLDSGLEDTKQGPQASSSATTPQEGSLLKMRLVQRPQITTLALPRSDTWPSDLLPPHQAPFHFLPDVYNFAKFMLATSAYLISDLTRNLDELVSERRTLETMDDCSIIFVDAAVIKVLEQIEDSSALESPILKDRIEKAHRDRQEISDRFTQHQKAVIDDNLALMSEIPYEHTASHCEGNSTPVSFSPRQNRNQPRQRRNLNPPPPSTATYYYYQAASGIPIFLHPLDIRILLAHFHDYSSFPEVITVQVESVSEGTVNDDLRKRCKYLAHMPEGADVVFVETNLEGVVGAEGLRNFEAALKMRTARRKGKERKEEKARVKAEEREKERLNSHTSQWVYSTRLENQPKEDFSALRHVESSSTSTPSIAWPAPVASGAWGTRSFASALHSSPSRGLTALHQPSSHITEEDEWDLDVAWHELEQRRGGGGRRKRANKLVVIGSGGGGVRRR